MVAGQHIDKIIVHLTKNVGAKGAVQIDRKQFSEAELSELLTFYRSPVGKKLVERRQQLLDDGLRGIQAWSAKFSREVEARVRDEMKKRGFTI